MTFVIFILGLSILIVQVHCGFQKQLRQFGCVFLEFIVVNIREQCCPLIETSRTIIKIQKKGKTK